MSPSDHDFVRPPGAGVQCVTCGATEAEHEHFSCPDCGGTTDDNGMCAIPCGDSAARAPYYGGRVDVIPTGPVVDIPSDYPVSDTPPLPGPSTVPTVDTGPVADTDPSGVTFTEGVPFCQVSPEQRESEVIDLSRKARGLQGLCDKCSPIVAERIAADLDHDIGRTVPLAESLIDIGMALIDTVPGLADAVTVTASKPAAKPIPMLMYCPRCCAKHVDTGEWAARPHRSHLCETCGHVWRHADVPTVGVDEIRTRGTLDGDPRPAFSPATPASSPPAVSPAIEADRARRAKLAAPPEPDPSGIALSPTMQRQRQRNKERGGS